jgi:hypothetical protein
MSPVTAPAMPPVATPTSAPVASTAGGIARHRRAKDHDQGRQDREETSSHGRDGITPRNYVP